MCARPGEEKESGDRAVKNRDRETDSERYIETEIEREEHLALEKPKTINAPLSARELRQWSCRWRRPGPSVKGSGYQAKTLGPALKILGSPSRFEMGNGRRSFASLPPGDCIWEHHLWNEGSPARRGLRCPGEQGSGWTMTWKRVSTSGVGQGMLEV